ncbi:hypothetical protein GF407_15875 [candidate division KSB1 bacterium]|nr:hypothetical protein [candidate division KSB1 bacterium]
MKPCSQTSASRNLFSRIDLHVHTKFSKNADDWLLKQLGVNECYTTPEEVYSRAMQNGMDFVTITDHDSIEGALQIAHKERFFISEEVSAFFPDDPVKIHLVVLDIDQRKHEFIQELRFNVYDLVDYLNKQDIIHFVAHPFFNMSTRLQLSHIHKMLLLFKYFEVKNGGKLIYQDDFLIRLLKTLTPEKLWECAEKYNITPRGKDPWIKYMVAGSDDHGGIYIGSPHTCIPKAKSVDQLLSFIRKGYTRAEGEGGSPIKIAHSIFSVAYRHFSAGKTKNQTTYNLLGHIFNQYDQAQSLSIKSRVALFGLYHLPEGSFLSGLKKQSRFSLLQKLVKSDPAFKQIFQQRFEFNQDDQRLLKAITAFINRVLIDLIPDVLQKPSSFMERLEEIKLVLPLMIPYLIGFKTEYRDRPLMRKAAKYYLKDDSTHFAVFARDVDVRDFIRIIRAQSANARNFSYRLFCNKSPKQSAQTYFFSPMKRVHIPAMDMEIDLYSLFDIGEAFYKKHIDKIYIHSFNSLAIWGLILGKWMQIPVVMRYPYPEVKAFFQKVPKNNINFTKKTLAFLLNLSDHVLLSSEKAKRHALQYGVRPKKMIFTRKSQKVRIVSYDKSISGYELTL